MKNSIESLEAQLNSAVAGAPAALEAINRRQTEAQNVIEAFASNPSPEQLGKAYAAHAAIATGRDLLARFGDLKAWRNRLESAWIGGHQEELVGLLEALIQGRSAHRQAFRESAAQRLGELTAAIVRADGNGADDVALEALNREIGGIETDLAARENRLLVATNALKSFARATERPGAYFSLYQSWCQARASAFHVSFEISEVPLCLEKP